MLGARSESENQEPGSESERKLAEAEKHPHLRSNTRV